MKILLPVCGSDDGKLIVDFVSNYHWPPNASFKVIHVLGSSATEEEYAQAEREATVVVGGVTERLNAIVPASAACWEILSGAAVYEIVETASKWHADMIVMGARTRVDIESFLAGSVSKGVVMQAPCSVVVIRPPSKNYHYVAEAQEREPLVSAEAGRP
jgi:nucleotide-binding universal stress UspA family protein